MSLLYAEGFICAKSNTLLSYIELPGQIRIKNGHLVKSFGHLPIFTKKIEWIFCVLDKKSGFLAIFQNDSGQRLLTMHRHILVVCPLSHFYLLFNVIKNL